MRPDEIEKRSMEIIQAELNARVCPPVSEIELPVVLRVIHTTADFEFAETMAFSRDAVQIGREALTSGAPVITDTNMAHAGISRPFSLKFGNELICKMADPRLAEQAKERGATRAATAMDWAAAHYPKGAVFVIGNAPTALIRLCELVEAGELVPALVIGVPVGFVNVVESKEMLINLPDTPYIVAKGRKGGSTVAVAIVNALYYGIDS